MPELMEAYAALGTIQDMDLSPAPAFPTANMQSPIDARL